MASDYMNKKKSTLIVDETFRFTSSDSQFDVKLW